MRSGEAVELPVSGVEFLRRYHAALDAIKLWEGERDYCKSRLIDCLQIGPGDWAPVGTIDDKPAVRYIRYETRRVDLKALRRHAPGVADQFTAASVHFRFTVEVP